MSVSMLKGIIMNVEAFQTKSKYSGIEQLKELLQQLIATRSDELPPEAFQSKSIVKEYFLNDIPKR